MADPQSENIRRFLKRRPSRPANPYSSLPGSNWWSKSMVETPPEEVDPVTQQKFTIRKKGKVATAGSCFAQHIARRLVGAGFNYLVTEQAPP